MDRQIQRRNGLTQRRIPDIWLALKTTGAVFSALTIAGGILGVVVSFILASLMSPTVIIAVILLTWAVSFLFIFRVWITYQEGIVIDADSCELSFPANDVENSVMEIITFKQFFDHARRATIRLASIESVMNETRARRGLYAVNVSGSFGSQQFAFDSKQKRDEFRAALDWGAKEAGTFSKQDRNSDVGGYGN